VILRSETLLSPDAWAHGFTGRCAPDGRPLDLGTGATPNVWARAAEAIGCPGVPIAYCSQVHGRQVLEAKRGGHVGEGDALVTSQDGLLLAMRVADCVPIVVAGDGAVAAIHAGWRGLAAGVIGATLEVLGPGRWMAVVGPSICVDCYEVGEEVVDGLTARTPESVVVRRDLGPRPHVDLSAAAAHQLQMCGVADVEQISCCTRCSPRHWSYRQQGAQAGRQAGIVGLRC
jgi:YfiH family protein